MISLGIGVMMVVMVVTMVMLMPVMVVTIRITQAAFTGAEGRTKIAIFDITARGSNTGAFNMVVVAFLRQADFIFKAEHLGAVFAH